MKVGAEGSQLSARKHAQPSGEDTKMHVEVAGDLRCGGAGVVEAGESCTQETPTPC